MTRQIWPQSPIAKRGLKHAPKRIRQSRRSIGYANGCANVAPRAIFGADDRQDFYEIQDPDLVLLAQSTVIITGKNRVQANGNGKFSLDVQPFRFNGLPPCSNERFGNQHLGGHCTGFLVAPDIIATAGHCINANNIESVAFLFGFQANDPADPGTTIFQGNQVYFGKEVVAKDNAGADFALVRVDRKIDAPGAQILPVRASGAPNLNDRIGVIGYPYGLPVKLAFGEQTRLKRISEKTISGNLDTFFRNSGSPVFSEDGLVEGILISGAADFTVDHLHDCFRSKRHNNAAGDEDATRASVFAHLIPSTLTDPPPVET